MYCDVAVQSDNFPLDILSKDGRTKLQTSQIYVVNYINHDIETGIYYTLYYIDMFSLG